LISDLITDLNQAGYITSASCQGRRSEEEFWAKSLRKKLGIKTTHIPGAYIYFSKTISSDIVDRLKEMEILVYGHEGGVAINDSDYYQPHPTKHNHYVGKKF